MAYNGDKPVDNLLKSANFVTMAVREAVLEHISFVE
jgi:hypothetical protein